jgi:Flp pilus assembly pilin Flp
MLSFRALLRDDAAQGLVEYALVIGLISLVSITALRFLGTRVTNTIQNAAAHLS